MSRKQSIYERFKLPIADLWVFGYGSLMWDPGFQYAESSRGRIFGYHRALCIQSVRYRGTHEVPGLVFGLDRGGSCTGIAYRIESEKQREVADYLQDREMLNEVYDPSIKSIVLDDGRSVRAVAFIVRRQHPSYVRNLTLDETASIVAKACGQRGANHDYVASTVRSLRKIGIHDQTLSSVDSLAQRQTRKTTRPSS